ncbi:DUF1697 domain-containing protein [Acidimangrovimonas sediminis]|uniref:DUF1697 domain-containing protein n=1 Tax=Acidimangrovimonas sediminis TaxID=2056283 RepID=UPI000C7F887D|nr:DUF1697 domain-containing protein [Acidimangrovimonas sediminis]
MTERRTWVALLRGIGGATHARMSMADLRHAATAAGFEEVRTVLATGNLVFASARPEAAIRSALEAVVADHGLTNAVILRDGAALGAIAGANPFAEAARLRPAHVLVHFLAELPAAGHEARLAGYAGPEAVVPSGREVFIDYVEGIGRSKLTAPRLERIFGVTGTARNWSTLGRLIAAVES